MIARVLLLIAPARATGSIQYESFTSTRNGTAFVLTTAVAVATHVNPGTITSSPTSRSRDSSATTRLALPLAMGTQYFVPTNAAKRSPNCRSIDGLPTQGPLIVQRPDRTTSVSALMVSSVYAGQLGQGLCLTEVPPFTARIDMSCQILHRLNGECNDGSQAGASFCARRRLARLERCQKPAL